MSSIASLATSSIDWIACAQIAIVVVMLACPARFEATIWVAERYEEMLKALLRGEVEIEDVCGEIDRIHTFKEYGVLTNDRGLVVTMADGKRIQIAIRVQ